MRNCFLPPIPALDEAASLLDDAVNSSMHGDHETARQLICKADIPEIFEFSVSIVGRINPKIHRQSSLPKDSIPQNKKVTQRMPSASLEQAIFSRDGWRCRFCETRVISKKARKLLVKSFPDVARWGTKHTEQHYALSALSISLDHLLPHSRGGTNDESNLVTACSVCQFGRNTWTLEEVEFNDPRERPPIVDDWDGLTRILKAALVSGVA